VPAPPQLVVAAANAAHKTIMSREIHRRLRREKNMSAIPAAIVPPSGSGRPALKPAGRASALDVVIVSEAIPLPVLVPGVKLHVAPRGKPVQLKEIVPVNPFRAMT